MCRISEKEMFVEILGTMERRSTCARVQVAAVIVRNGRVISTGWNGVPAGQEHCCDKFSEQIKNSEEFLELHRKFSEHNELHAEMNAITYAARIGIATEDADIYCSVSPCINCAKAIVAAGIKSVFYRDKYDRGLEGIELLSRCGVNVIQL
jgi:dCMP deaminase